MRRLGPQCRNGGRRRERGAALVTSLLCMTLLYALGLALLLSTTTDTLISNSYRASEEAFFAATSADPQLGALTDNGGPTLTMLPSATSPLVGEVAAGACTAQVTADQRGVTRPRGAACTVGAVEVESPPDPPPTTTTANS